MRFLFHLYSQNDGSLRFSLFFLYRRKSRGAISGEYEDRGTMPILFLAKNLEQAMMCEQVHCRAATAMNCFATMNGVSFGLLHANGVELVNSTPY